MDHKKFMQMAIDKVREAIADTAFGACIVKDGQVISCEHNVVWETTDVTAHAEIHAIRSACKKLGTIDLSGCVMYTTCEPCPMCFAACHWAGIETIIYGADIADAQQAGFNELTISAETMKELGASKVEVVKDFMKKECAQLFQDWKEAGGKSY